MDSKRIEELLNRYWNCETTLEEESQLREYFQGSTIPAEHKEAAALFQYFHKNKNQTIQAKSFDADLIRRVKPKGKVVTLINYSLRIAAGIAVLVVAIWFVRTEINKTQTAQNLGVIEDEKLAFEQTKKALMMISENFGKAEQEAKKINLFNKAQEEIQKK
jgi:hypothetical protein